MSNLDLRENSGEKNIMNEINQEKDELSRSERDAIFRYVVSLFIPSAVAISIISGFIGFVAKVWTEERTYAAAIDYKNATDSIIKQGQLAAEARKEAEIYRDNMKKMEENGQTARLKIDDAVKATNEKADKIAAVVNGQISYISNELVKDEKFRQSLISSTSTTIDKLLSDIERQNSYINSVKDVINAGPIVSSIEGNQTGSNNPGPVTLCPTGHYAVGVKWSQATPNVRYCVGCADGLTVICRKLKPL